MSPRKMNDERALRVVNDTFFNLTWHDAVEKLDACEHIRVRLQDAVDYERRWSELVETTARRIESGEDQKEKP